MAGCSSWVIVWHRFWGHNYDWCGRTVVTHHVAGYCSKKSHLIHSKFILMFKKNCDSWLAELSPNAHRALGSIESSRPNPCALGDGAEETIPIAGNRDYTWAMSLMDAEVKSSEVFLAKLVVALREILPALLLDLVFGMLFRFRSCGRNMCITER